MFTRVVGAVLAALLLVPPADALCCGEKFFVPNRATRFKAKVDRGSAAVLFFAPPGSVLAGALSDQLVVERLRAAGYRPTLVGDRNTLERALANGRWDVVVVDLADAPDVGPGQPVGVPPVMLPVTGQVTRASLGEARKRYRRIVKTPVGDRTLVHALDDVLLTRGAKRAKPTKRAGE